MSLNMTNTVDRGFIFVDEAHKDQMNAAAKNWDPDDGTGTFGDYCRLSESGVDPAEFYGANTRVTQTMKNAINGQAHAPHVNVYWESNGWTWKTALVDLALVQIFDTPPS